jgi:hypothetical protein
MGSPSYPPPPQGPPPGGYPPPRPPGYPPYRLESFVGRQVRIGLEREARRLALLKYLWPVLVLLVVCGIGGYIGNRVLTSRSGTAQSAPATSRAAAASFIRHLVADDLDSAYAELCATTQAAYDRARFAEHAHARKIESWPAPARGTPSSSPAPGAVNVEYFVLNYADGTSELHGFPVVWQAGRYRICGDPY